LGARLLEGFLGIGFVFRHFGSLNLSENLPSKSSVLGAVIAVLVREKQVNLIC
jgi:hypothetical protein